MAGFQRRAAPCYAGYLLTNEEATPASSTAAVPRLQSLSDMAVKLGLSSESEAEESVVRAARSGLVSARIDRRTGTVAFSDMDEVPEGEALVEVLQKRCACVSVKEWFYRNHCCA